ncbi:hypothetical protein ACLB2K_069299 [Fragaria x ananassa]
MVDSKGMVKAEDVKSFIKPLNGKDDFTLWRRRMKSVLILQDLYDAVLGIENKAVDMADKVWQKMDKKARSTIELHLADHVLGRVLDSGGDNMSSKETWDYLEKVLNAAWDANIPVASENALNCHDREGYNKILENAKPLNDPDGRHLSAFTYLRLSPVLLERHNFMEFERFVKKMHGEAATDLQINPNEENTADSSANLQ